MNVKTLAVVFALIGVAGCGGTIDPTNTGDDTAALGSHRTCQVSPDPVASGAFATISGSGLKPGLSILIGVTGPDPYLGINPGPVAADGTYSAPVSRTLTGIYDVSVDSYASGKRQHLADCSFTVE